MKIIVGLSLVIVSANGAVAFTKQQESVLSQIGGATTASRICDGMTLNRMESYKMIVEAGILDSTTGKVPSEANAQINQGVKLLVSLLKAPKDREGLCLVLWVQYGPDGGGPQGGHRGLLKATP